jgi:protocatechuate 3,4-dioxygenase beta subunit
LTRRQTAGPYLRPNSPLRSDIREDRTGVAIQLELKVIGNASCLPVEDCVVDVWQCDANGLYSAVENAVFDPATYSPGGDSIDRRDEIYLRGHQRTDKNGIAAFTTIYPGWYYPRLTHIHVRVMTEGLEWSKFDTQIYLPAEIEKEVFRKPPYSARGPNPIDVKTDGLLKGDAGILDVLTMDLVPDSDGYKGRVEIVANLG